MIGLLPLPRAVAFIAVGYAVVIGVLLYVQSRTGVPLTLPETLAVATGGLTVLTLALALILKFGWRVVWKVLPFLNEVVFPDIAGEWDMQIAWHKGAKNGQIEAAARVKQDFIHVSMEVSSPGSESETLIALPRRDAESGRPLLYYVYRIIPNSINSDAGSPYHGSAILKISNRNELSGNYFTSKGTQGHFKLTRRSLKR